MITRNPQRDWRPVLQAGVIVLLVFAAYFPALRGGFIWDDAAFLVDNPLIKAGNGLYQFWFTTAAPDYFPMTSTTLWLEWRLWGNHPLGYHLVNLLLHAASSVLLWRVLTRLKIPGGWLAAAIFALHPVNVQSVAWITERKNTLAMFFYAWALLGYLRFEDTGRKRWYGLALGAFALALLSKTAVVPLPLVLLGLAWWQRGRLEWKDIRRTIPLFAAAFLLGLITARFQYHHIGAVIVRADSFWSRLAGAGCAVWFYLYKALWPMNLMFVYPRWSIEPARPLSYVPGLLLAGVFLAGVWRRGQWAKAMLFALGYFVVMLMPVLGFLNIYFMRYSLVADYWQYFAIPGPITLMAAVLTAAWKSWGRASLRLGIVLAGALLLALGALTWKQAGIYRNIETLWRDTLARNPNCWMAYNSLGCEYVRNGRLNEAVENFRKSVQIHPGNAEAQFNLGSALAGQRNFGEAIQHYTEALSIAPGFLKAQYGLGCALQLEGRFDEAMIQYQMVLKATPDDAGVHNNLGTLLAEQGRLEEAAAQYVEVIRLVPNNPETHYNLASVLLRTGRRQEALAHLTQALQLKPDYSQAKELLDKIDQPAAK
jgi:tetratricopeptide (TPR) repeat protein